MVAAATNASSGIDLHTHLFGCLSAEDVWEMGRDRCEQQSAALDWYAAEYLRVTGRSADWRRYWQSPSGLEQLRQDFLLREPTDFATFQAKFNLLIALFPLSAANAKLIAQHVLSKDAAAGMRAVEYRTILPTRFSDREAGDYLRGLCAVAAEISQSTGGRFAARFALSLPRPNQDFADRYALLRSWLAANPKAGEYISGIDLCGFEESDPPSSKIALFRTIRADNKQHKPLSILHHVGESFVGLSLASAARRVYEAAAAGADRLGHALALGLDPDLYPHSHWHEQRLEHLYHLRWLEAADWLEDFGYRRDVAALRQQILACEASNEAVVAIDWNTEERALTRSLQNALMQAIRNLGTVIESCPTSNHLISAQPLSEHPLRRFVASGISVVLASDDPGIMATNLDREYALCEQAIGLNQTQVRDLTTNAEQVAIDHLALSQPR